MDSKFRLRRKLEGRVAIRAGLPCPICSLPLRDNPERKAVIDLDRQTAAKQYICAAGHVLEVRAETVGVA